MRPPHQPRLLGPLTIALLLSGCLAPTPVDRWALPDRTDARAPDPAPDAAPDPAADAAPQPLAPPVTATAPPVTAATPPDAAPDASGPEVAAPALAPTEPGSCGELNVDLPDQPGELLLLLDRSGSMDEPLGASDQTVAASKWDEMAMALDEVIAGTQDRIAWGLKLFPAPVGSVCGVPDGVTVPLALRNHAAISAAIAGSHPQAGEGATPTEEVVRKALAFLETDGRKRPHLLIATDGIPNCRGSTVTTEQDNRAAAQVVASARAAGVSSFVVGIATATSTGAHAALNAMAEGSGHARPGGTKYFPAASRAEMVAALGTIIGQITSCSFGLPTAPPAPENVVVALDGVPVPRDPAAGWSYGPAGDTIVLVGPACDKVKTTPTSKVRVVYGCPPVP